MGAEGMLESIVFEGGKRLARHALFFNTQTRQASDLATRLACDFDEQGGGGAWPTRDDERARRLCDLGRQMWTP